MTTGLIIPIVSIRKNHKRTAAAGEAKGFSGGSAPLSEKTHFIQKRRKPNKAQIKKSGNFNGNRGGTFYKTVKRLEKRDGRPLKRDGEAVEDGPA